MNTIDKLFEQLESFESETRAEQSKIQSQIQNELNAVFDDWKELQDAIKKLESFDKVEYYGAEDGIYSFVRFDLTDVPEREQDYLRDYLMDKHCMYPEFKNDVLTQFQGDDCILIQDEHGRDNGVYQGHKCILDEDEYKDEDGEINEERRNELIEQHMERTGWYPGVFRLTRYGDVYPVNTQAKAGE